MLCDDLKNLKDQLMTATCRPIMTELTRLVCGRCPRVESCPTLGLEQVTYLQIPPRRPN